MVCFQPTVFYIEYDPYSFTNNDSLSHSDVEKSEARCHVNHVTVLWHSCDVMWLVLVWAQFIYSIMWKGTLLFVKLKTFFHWTPWTLYVRRGRISVDFPLNVLALCVPLPSAKKENYSNNRHRRNTSSIFRPSQLKSLTPFASSYLR